MSWQKYKKTIIFLMMCISLFFLYQSTITAEETQPSLTKPVQAAAIKEELHFVYITGAVRKPGLYELSKEVCKADLLASAGGALPYADLDSVNLAETVQVGEHWHIDFNFKGTPEELLRPVLVNINQANKEALEKLPGIGPAMAERILNYRREHKKFTNVEELQKVKGIGPQIFNKIKELVTV